MTLNCLYRPSSFCFQARKRRRGVEDEERPNQISALSNQQCSAIVVLQMIESKFYNAIQKILDINHSTAQRIMSNVKKLTQVSTDIYRSPAG